jgi:hypothetical protein
MLKLEAEALAWWLDHIEKLAELVKAMGRHRDGTGKGSYLCPIQAPAPSWWTSGLRPAEVFTEAGSLWTGDSFGTSGRSTAYCL